MPFLRVTALTLACAGLAFLATACSTTPKVDWDSRIGVMTYDQAVTELGPPESSAKVGDGSTVAEWFEKRNSQASFNLGTGFYGSHGSVGVGQSVSTGASGQYLRLTFTSDGRLARWERVRR